MKITFQAIVPLIILAVSVSAGELRFNGQWGSWRDITWADQGYYLCGANMRFQASQGGGDDTATNGFSFVFCRFTNWSYQQTKNFDGIWGSWKGLVMCPDNHFVNGMQVRFEDPVGGGDDSAFNGLRLSCKSIQNKKQTVITVYEGLWGNWKNWQKIAQNRSEYEFINGFQIRFEGRQGGRDDTALNGLVFYTKKVQVRSYDFQYNVPPDFTLTQRVLAIKTLRNQINNPTSQKVQLPIEVKTVHKWQNQLQYFDGIEIKTAIKVPKINQKLQLVLQEQEKTIVFGKQYQEKKLSLQTIQIQCPPCKICTIKAKVSQSRQDIPYILVITYKNGQNNHFLGSFKGIVTSQSYNQVSYESSTVCLAATVENIAKQAKENIVV